MGCSVYSAYGSRTIKLEVDLEIGAAAERASPARRPARTHPRQHVCEPDRQVVEPDLAGARRCRRPSTDAEAELRHVGLHAQAERLDLRSRVIWGDLG